jgi:hypothetical protein
MLDFRTMVGAFCLTLGLAAPVTAATYHVDFQIIPDGTQTTPVAGRLFFDDISDGTRNATGIEVTGAPGGTRYLGPYVIANSPPSFAFDFGAVTVADFFQAFQNPADQAVSLVFTALDNGFGELLDYNVSDPDILANSVFFAEPQPGLAPIPLPASLPLLLAGLGGLLPSRGRPVRAQPSAAAPRHLMRQTMFQMTKILCAACLVLAISAPARAATYMVTFGVPDYGSPVLQGQLFFSNRFGNQVPTKLILTVAPGGDLYLGEYAFVDPSAVFDLERDYAQIVAEGTAFKIGNGNYLLDFIPSSLVRLSDLSKTPQRIVDDGANFSAPVEVNQSPSPVPLPAALLLMLAGLGGLVALRRGRTRPGPAAA